MTASTAILIQRDQPERQQTADGILRSLATDPEALGGFGVEQDRRVTSVASGHPQCQRRVKSAPRQERGSL